MKIQFPIIKNISDVLPAIEGKDEFIVAERDGFRVVNYLVQLESSFQDPNEDGISSQEREYRLIRRECRGIIFCSETGNIISRRLNKFFNLGEKAETNCANIDLSEPHIVLSKLDGSFIGPFFANGKMIYGTKMGETDVSHLVYSFVCDKPQYYDFNAMLLEKGFSPTYEFVSPQNRIVIPYQETNLILLAIRNMITGEYHDYETMTNLAAGFDIPVVKARTGSISNMEKFAEETRDLTGVEGFVVRFASGLQIKMKCQEYIVKHRVKDEISGEKNLLNLIFSEKIDDVYAILDESDVLKVKKYTDFVLGHAMNLASNLTKIVEDAKVSVGEDRKRFALEIVSDHKAYSSLLFTIWNGRDAFRSIQEYVLNNCQTQTKVDMMRHILGDMIWQEVYSSNPSE